MTEPLARVETATAAPGTVHVVIRGEIDMSNVDELRPLIDRALETRPSVVLVDVSDVEYIDTQGLRLLCELAGSGGYELAVIAPSGTIARQVIDITSLDAQLDVRDGPPTG